MNTVICANTVPAPWRIAVLNQSEPTLAWIFFPVAPRVAPQIRPSDALCGFALLIICFSPILLCQFFQVSMMLILAL